MKEPQNTLKITISGVRGIIGGSLSPNIPLSFGRAFGSFVNGGKVVVGMDPRPSGLMVKQGLLCGLTASGCDVIDIGIAPTPTVQVMVKELEAAGGVVITASHNPIEWNGLKFIRSDGIFLNALQAERLLSHYHGWTFRRPPWNQLGKIREDGTAVDRHIRRILSAVDVETIRRRHFKVVLDCANGAGAVIAPRLLQLLGCEVALLHTKLGIPFERPPEPIPKNLGKLCRVVKHEKADLGFAQDADADRLAMVDERGEPLGEEYTLVLAADYVLSKQAGIAENGNAVSVVTNLSTTMAMDEVAEKHQAKLFRTKIGEVNVSEKMKDVKALVGGEGNGGIIFPQVGFGRDSLVGMALILECLARVKQPISVLMERLPHYEMVKRTVSLPDSQIEMFLDRIREKFSEQTLDLTDGVKIFYPKGWVHVRGSNTEPIMRVIAEAESQGEAIKLCDTVIRELK